MKFTKHAEYYFSHFQKKDKKGNAEYEEEKRQEKEKQEKAIGLLTYLGQSAIEAQSKKFLFIHT